MNSIFSLRAHAARELPQLRKFNRCHAAKKPAIQANRSEGSTAKEQVADKAILAPTSAFAHSHSSRLLNLENDILDDQLRAPS